MRVYYIDMARVKIWYQGEHEWSLSCYQAMKLWMTHDFLGQLDNGGWHQAVLPQHKTEIKHTPFNCPNSATMNVWIKWDWKGKLK